MSSGRILALRVPFQQGQQPSVPLPLQKGNTPGNVTLGDTKTKPASRCVVTASWIFIPDKNIFIKRTGFRLHGSDFPALPVPVGWLAGGEENGEAVVRTSATFIGASENNSQALAHCFLISSPSLTTLQEPKGPAAPVFTPCIPSFTQQ